MRTEWKKVSASASANTHGHKRIAWISSHSAQIYDDSKWPKMQFNSVNVFVTHFSEAANSLLWRRWISFALFARFNEPLELRKNQQQFATISSALNDCSLNFVVHKVLNHIYLFVFDLFSFFWTGGGGGGFFHARSLEMAMQLRNVSKLHSKQYSCQKSLWAKRELRWFLHSKSFAIWINKMLAIEFAAFLFVSSNAIHLASRTFEQFDFVWLSMWWLI